jgi:transposase
MGRMTQAGDPGLRAALYEAAAALLGRVTKWSALKAWGVHLARRSVTKKARVAVARKLAVLLLSM